MSDLMSLDYAMDKLRQLKGSIAFVYVVLVYSALAMQAPEGNPGLLIDSFNETVSTVESFIEDQIQFVEEELLLKGL